MPRWSSSPSSGCRATRSTTCFTREPCSDGVVETPSGGSPAESAESAAGARRSAPRCAASTGCSTARWSSTAAGSSASSRRATCPSTASTTRSASSAPLATRLATRSGIGDADVPVRGRPAVLPPATCPDSCVHVEVCEDLWVPIPPSTFGALAGATVLANLSASNITIGKAGFRRDAVLVAVGAHDRRLRVHRGRHGRVDHRRGLGWAGADLRERRPAGRGRALLDRGAADRLRHRPRPARLRPGQHVELRRLDPRLPPTGSPRCAGSSSSWALSERLGRAAAPAGGALPVRAGRPGEPERALRGGLQHPGARARDPAGGHRDREDRDRRLRRPRLHPRADRRRPRGRPPGPARARTCSPTRCRASPPASTRCATPTG